MGGILDLLIKSHSPRLFMPVAIFCLVLSDKGGAEMVESSIPILRRCVGFAGLGTPPTVISGGEMLGHFPG